MVDKLSLADKRRLLAQKLASQRKTAPDGPVPQGTAEAEAERPMVRALSAAQKRLLFLDALEGGTATYAMPVAARLSGVLGVERLCQALSKVQERHEVLRARFDIKGQEPVQYIMPARPVALRKVDLQQDPAADQSLVREIESEMAAPFDLAAGPLWRASLYQLSAETHVLSVVFHHVICDGWSLGVFLQEVVAFYGTEPHAPVPETFARPLPVQYHEFALWQRRWGRSEAAAGQKAYWMQQLADLPALLPLPTDHPRPAVQSFAGCVHRFQIPADLGARLQRFGATCGLTPYMVHLAAFGYLLHRYAGVEDIAIGTPVANRNRTEIEGLIGLFVNTLVMRLRLQPEASMAQYLAMVKSVAIEGFNAQDLPFEDIVEALRPERSLSHTPLFQVILNLQPEAQGAVDMQGITVAPLAFDPQTAKCDLQLILMQSAQGMEATIEYATDLFEAETIARFAQSYIGVLEDLVATPPDALTTRALSRLAIAPLVSGRGPGPDRRAATEDAARHQMDIGPPAAEFLSIPARFTRHARRTPEATALIDDAGTMSYAALERASSACAAQIAERASPGAYVLLLCGRSRTLVMSMLACLKARVVYVPVDPDMPQARLSSILEEITPAAVLVDDTTVQSALVQGMLAKIHRISLHNTVDARAQDHDADDAGLRASGSPHPEDPIYAIYTSGSTGRPKGVLMAHRGLANLVDHFAETMHVAPGMVTLGANRPSFDMSVLDWFLPLTTGGALAIATPRMMEDPRALLGFIETCGATVMQMTPTRWRLLLDLGFTPKAGQRLVTGGEPTSPDVQRDLTAGDAQVLNLYGPTETCVWSTQGQLRAGRNITAGHAIRGAQILIVDSRMRPVPPGVPGEILIGGQGLAHGYVARPALTAPAFVPNPLSASGERMYRTGDRGRWRADGQLQILGRADGQVKIRGLRVELGEIEAALSRLPAVAQCAVRVFEPGTADAYIAAYVQPHDPQPPQAEALLDDLRARLPDFMLPSRLTFVPQMPLTASGKIDRKALPRPPRAQTGKHQRDTHFTGAAHSSTEAELMTLWRSLLDLPHVGRLDDFFQIGGHSLKAVQLAMRINERFGDWVALKDLIAHRTPAAQARLLDGRKRQGPAPLVPAPKAADYPLTRAQQRLWMLAKLEGASARFSIPSAYLFDDRLDAQALVKALLALPVRHEALRTRIVETEPGQARQRIAPPDSVTVEQPAAHIASHDIQERLTLLAVHPFDLENDPLCRMVLQPIEGGGWLLFVNLHHIIADGWSFRVLYEDLSALYAANQSTTPAHASLPAAPEVQFKDYAVWESAQDSHADESYWRQRLSPAPEPIQLPQDRPEPAEPSFAGHTLSVLLTPQEVLGLRKLADAQGQTLAAVVFSLFFVFLNRLTGQSDLAVAMSVANRTHPKLENTVGFFVNSVVLRQTIERDMELADLVRAVGQDIARALEHQSYPFDALVQMADPPRRKGFQPVFNVCFVYQSFDDMTLTQGPAPEGLPIAQELWAQSQTSKFDLSLFATEQRDEEGQLSLELGFEFSTELFDRATFAKRLDLATQLFRAVARS